MAQNLISAEKVSRKLPESIDRSVLPEDARFRQIHDGHCTYMQPEERCFVTPEAIRAGCVIGAPEEIVEQLRALEKSGIKELNLLPAADYQKNVWRDFAEMVIPAFR